MDIIYTNGKDIRFIELCRELDNFLNEAVGVEEQGEYNQYNTLEDIHDVVLLMENNKAIACGSFKEYESQVAEMKRVFVKKDYRKRGLSKLIIKELEAKAKANGYTKLILETGKQLKTAIITYKSYGYTIRNNFGQYENMPDSVCMEKVL
jgi:GNAT superfamily N-acetyltransferase